MLNRLRDRLGRTGLIVAAALHLLGATLVASAHAEPAPAGEAVVAIGARGADGGEQSPEPHHAQHCAVCQAIGTSALPVERASTAALDSPSAPAAGPEPRPAPARYPCRASARAPPAAA